MNKVKVRSYLSPTLVYLAMDWDDGFKHEDFLGFAIQRTPGFRNKIGGKQNKSDWLPNRIGFNGPNPKGADLPSDTNPIQHFQWFDARIDSQDRGKTIEYTVYPVIGPWNKLDVNKQNATTISCKIPELEENGIGTYFNRAVVSSQAFIREFGAAPTGNKYIEALNWLSNGMGEAVKEFIGDTIRLDGAAYHLTDPQWVIPALKKFKTENASFIYFYKKPGTGKDKGDTTNVNIVNKILEDNVTFYRRTRTSIMHDKFIVRSKSEDGPATDVLMGTANFTLEGLTSQANVIHTFKSQDLAELYLQRQKLLRTDPTVQNTARGAKWSNNMKVGDAEIRVFFPPEYPAKGKKNPGSRISINTVVNAVKNAKSSVIFSLFSATDMELLDACKSVAENGKMMYGLVNQIDPPKPPNPNKKTTATNTANVALYNMSKDDNMVVGHSDFGKGKNPKGFWWEVATLRNPNSKVKIGKGGYIPQVYDHQKIVVVDGESDNPTIFVGSANLSGNSTWHNDENLLEITNCSSLAQMYVAEVLRIFEHYRSRFAWNQRQNAKSSGINQETFSLTKDTSWCANDFKSGTPQYKARITLA